MGLASDILFNFHQLLSEHGVTAWRKTIDVLVLVSRLRSEQQIEMGGFVESPDFLPSTIHNPRSTISPALRRARLPSRSGVRHRRRNRLARGADSIDAADPGVPIPALPAAAKWGAGVLEHHWRR